jgi:outer membrane lipase/esterase
MKQRLVAWLVCLACLVAPTLAQAGPFSNIFFFGDSLSDSGNNFLGLGGATTPVPIANNSFIPTFPYASTHYTNGKVWAQTFAEAFGLTATPSLLGGNDFAFGGARTGPLTLPPADPAGFPFSLQNQVLFFLDTHGGVAPSDALYVIAGGGNNARDALDAIGGGAPLLPTIAATASGFASDIATMLTQLEGAGAEHIVVWTAPDAGKAPAVIAAGGSFVGTLVSSAMNGALEDLLLDNPGLAEGVQVFDLFALLQAVTAPGAPFFTNVTDACARFVVSATDLGTCDPTAYLFWDGIHPTSGGHALIASAMIALIPEPSALALLLVAVAAAALALRRGAPGLSASRRTRTTR